MAGNVQLTSVDKAYLQAFLVRRVDLLFASLFTVLTEDSVLNNRGTVTADLFQNLNGRFAMKQHLSKSLPTARRSRRGSGQRTRLELTRAIEKMTRYPALGRSSQ